jgi:predicted nucleic acid-binding protein
LSAKAKPVLIDTSIWVGLLRDPNYRMRGYVDELVAEDRARLCGAISAELLQGATTAKDTEAVEELSSSLPLMPATDESWKDAGHLSRKLRSKGITVGLMDCYIAAIAMSHGCMLLSEDKHFPLIAKHSSLDMAEFTS